MEGISQSVVRYIYYLQGYRYYIGANLVDRLRIGATYGYHYRWSVCIGFAVKIIIYFYSTLLIILREPMSKLKYIKIILVLLLKSYLIYLWVNFVGAFTHLLYYIYILKVYSLEHFGLFLFFLFGNICSVLWLVLWCKRLPPAFNKPKIYYEVKDWIRMKKAEALIYKVLFGSLLLLLKLCLVVYILIIASMILSISVIYF